LLVIVVVLASAMVLGSQASGGERALKIESHAHLVSLMRVWAKNEEVKKELTRLAHEYSSILDLSKEHSELEKQGLGRGKLNKQKRKEKMKELWGGNIFALFDDASTDFDWMESSTIKKDIIDTNKFLQQDISQAKKDAKAVEDSYYFSLTRCKFLV